jgi:hypothetical protein
VGDGDEVEDRVGPTVEGVAVKEEGVASVEESTDDTALVDKGLDADGPGVDNPP